METTSRHLPIVLLGAGHAEALSLLEAEPPEGQRVVRVEASGLSSADLATAVLRSLGVVPEAPEPSNPLQAAIHQLGGAGLLLLLSGGSSLPPQTAVGLREWIQRLDGDLRVVVAMGPPAQDVLDGLAPVSAEIQVDVLGPRPAAARVRRMLSSGTGEARTPAIVTMAQLAKSRRRKRPGPQEGFAPEAAPVQRETRPITAATPHSTPRAAASSPGEAALPARAPLADVDPSASPPLPGPASRYTISRGIGRGIAAALLVAGATWWALGPDGVTDRVLDRSTGRPPQVELLPSVSVGPPDTTQHGAPRPAPGVLPSPAAIEPEKPATAVAPAPESDEISSDQAGSVPTLDDFVEPEPSTAGPQTDAGLVPAEPAPAGLDLPEPGPPVARAEATVEPTPPIIRDPSRVPEILRVGPPSPRPASIEPSEGVPENASAVTTEALPVAIDAEPPARVRVDGRMLGPTPIREARLLPGIHSFYIEFENGQVSERSIRVDATNQRFLFRLVPTDSR